MLNGNTLELQRERAYSLPQSHQQFVLKVELDTGCSALSRLANLMAKLDIEPGSLRAEKCAVAGVLDITIDFGGDLVAMERLMQRLSGMVSVRSVDPGAPASAAV